MSRKAIIVGIDNYPGAALKGCGRDANDLFRMLQRNADEEKTINFDAEVYTDTEISTAGKLNNLIEELFKGDHDIALFYFSGHGTKTPHGTVLAAPDYLTNPGVPIKHVLETAAASTIRTKIIILDCCYSGDAGKMSTRIPDIMLANNMIILAASRADEYSAMKKQQSVFTNLLLQALDGGAADISGNISPEGVYAMIDKSLGSFDQRPVFMANVDRFHVLRKVKPLITIKSLQRITDFFALEDSEHMLDRTYEHTEKDVAIPEHIEIFTILQQMNRTGLVLPVGEKDMYWAAMHNKPCVLTPIGKHYWRLRKSNRF
jgi:hypothetical protein